MAGDALCVPIYRGKVQCTSYTHARTHPNGRVDELYIGAELATERGTTGVLKNDVLETLIGHSDSFEGRSKICHGP